MHLPQGYYLIVENLADCPQPLGLCQKGYIIGPDKADICLPELDGRCRIYLENNIPYLAPLGEPVQFNGLPLEDTVVLPADQPLHIGGLKCRLEYHDRPENEEREEGYLKATTDPLTGVLNRREFSERAVPEIYFSLRHQRPLSLLRIEIDFLNTLYESFGRVCGDRIVTRVAQLLCAQKREEDLLARFENSSFYLLLREQELDNAAILAERIRHGVAELPPETSAESQLALTVSIGVCSFGECSCLTLETLLVQAGNALKHARELGRNRIYAAQYSGVI